MVFYLLSYAAIGKVLVNSYIIIFNWKMEKGFR